MVIDLTKIHTFSEDIINELDKYLRSLSNNKKLNLIKMCEKSDEDKTSVLEKLFPLQFSTTECDYFIPLFDRHQIILYHATKVIDPDSIKKTGLLTNDWNRYCENMIQTFQYLNVREEQIREAMGILQKEYKDKYLLCNPQVCMFTIIDELQSTTNGFEMYSECIGGELATVLRYKMPTVFNLLKEHGQTIVVKCAVPFKNITSARKDIIIIKVIRHYIAKQLWGYYYPIQLSCETEKDIQPNNILDVIHYEISDKWSI